MKGLCLRSYRVLQIFVPGGLLGIAIRLGPTDHGCPPNVLLPARVLVGTVASPEQARGHENPLSRETKLKKHRFWSKFELCGATWGESVMRPRALLLARHVRSQRPRVNHLSMDPRESGRPLEYIEACLNGIGWGGGGQLGSGQNSTSGPRPRTLHEPKDGPCRSALPRRILPRGLKRNVRPESAPPPFSGRTHFLNRGRCVLTACARRSTSVARSPARSRPPDESTATGRC